MAAARILEAQRTLTTSFVPEDEMRRPGCRSNADAIDAGGRAIHGEFSREIDPARRDARWNKMPEINRERFRAEAEACLAAAALAGWRP